MEISYSQVDGLYVGWEMNATPRMAWGIVRTAHCRERCLGKEFAVSEPTEQQRQELTTIPITVSAEAAARIAELGMQREGGRMLEHTSKAGAGLRSIEVTLMPACDPGDDPRVILEVTKDDPREANDPLWGQWCDWMVETFPSDV